MRITTYGLEWPRESQRLVRALSTIPKVEDILLYASGWPNADFEDPGEIAARLPETWRDKVMHDNAANLFRWPGSASNVTHATEARSGANG
jgi:predicted TIM-barrel fold metal-dependent hydrolase